MFLTYDQYESLGGTIAEEEFEAHERKARAYINAVTHNRIRDESPVREAVRLAAFELIDQMAHEADNDNNAVTGISSKSNDGVSVTYANGTVVSRYWKAKRRETLALYLADETVMIDGVRVPLLYGGVEYDGRGSS